MITLDPDDDTYGIIEVTDADHFTFNYYDEEREGDEAIVHCFDYSNLRGMFKAVRIDTIRWQATRIS